jgi:hypothetical protein
MIRILTFIGFIIFIGDNLLSQDESTKLSLDFYVQPNIDKKVDVLPNSDLQYYSGKFGIDCGVLINYSISDRFKLGAGITYINRGFTLPIKTNFIYYDPNNTNIKSGDIYYNENYFSIPLKIGYALLDYHKFEISPIIGIGLDYLFNLHNSAVEVYESKTVYKTVNPKIDSKSQRFVFSGFCGVDMLYHLNNKIDLLVSPNFNSMILPLKYEFNSNFKYYYWNLGCRFGLRKII